jgi:hypothetical protein
MVPLPSQDRPHGPCAAVLALDLIDYRVDLARGAAMVDQHLSARFPEG